MGGRRIREEDMNSAPTAPGRDGPEDRHTGCADCDPGLLDHLKCRAKGIQAQADYNKDHAKELDDERSQFNDARGLYSKARNDARPDEKKLAEQLGQMIEQLKCLVDEPRKIRLLDRAFEHIKHCLRKCYPMRGCDFEDDCDFDTAVDNCEDDDLAATIADIERRTAYAKSVFADLIIEPVNGPKRLEKLKTDVAAISTEMASDSRRVNFKELYARALVARDQLETLWRGFPNVNAYVDCLCRALTCQIKGYAAISRLKGKEAVRNCHRDQDKEACLRLSSQTADEVMAEYIRLRHEEHEQHEDSEESEHRDDRDRYRDRDRDRDDDWRSRRDSGREQ
jgi:hypothetical protein